MVTNNDVLEISAAIKPSPRAGVLVKLPRMEGGKCASAKICPKCMLGLDVKHTDVLILSQFLRSDGTMMPRRITGLCNVQQRNLGTMVLMARRAGSYCRQIWSSECDTFASLLRFLIEFAFWADLLMEFVIPHRFDSAKTAVGQQKAKQMLRLQRSQPLFRGAHNKVRQKEDQPDARAPTGNNIQTHGQIECIWASVFRVFARATYVCNVFV